MTLNEFINNELIPNTNLNLDFNRHELPQLKTDDFLNDLTKNNINYQIVSVNPKDLIPTQNEYNSDKLKSLVLSLRSGAENKPIMVSKDNYILDGHHRWAACSHINCEQPIYYIDKGIHDIMDFVKDKEYAKYKSINESVQNNLVLNEDSTENIGITEIENMKRQLVDLLRIRVQNINPPPPPKQFSDILAKYSVAILKSSPEKIKADYNEQVINNKITPLNTNENLNEEIFFRPPNLSKLKSDQDFLKAHAYYRGKDLDSNYQELLAKTPNSVFTKLASSGNYKDRLNVVKYGPPHLKPLVLNDANENVRAELAKDRGYHALLMHDNSKKVKNTLIDTTSYSNVLLHLARDTDKEISTKAKEKIQSLPFVSDNIKKEYT